MNRKKSKIASLCTVFGLAVMMTGCSQDEVVDKPVLSGGNEIAFRVSDARPNSALRASVTTMQNLNNFTLTGIKREGGNLLLDGVTVTRSANGADWEYFPKAAWPEKTKMVDFYAFSPANSLNVSSGFKGKTDHTLIYTVPTSPNEQEDFLVTVQEKAADPADNIVKLNFKHALSRVLVNARAATSLSGVDVVVKSVTFKNLAKRGTLALEKDAPQDAGNPAKEISFGWPLDHEILKYAAYELQDLETGGFTPAYTRIWEPDMTAKADYPLDMRGANGIKISNDGYTYTALTGEMSALMVMPQQTTWNSELNANPTDPANDFYLDIQYTVNGEQYNALKRVKDYWKRTEGSFCFEPGKAYEFNLVVGLSDDGGPNPSGAVEVMVNSVNDWYTTPDGIDVDRRWQEGDYWGLYDEKPAFVAFVDERGQPSHLATPGIIDVATLNARFDALYAANGECAMSGATYWNIMRELLGYHFFDMATGVGSPEKGAEILARVMPWMEAFGYTTDKHYWLVMLQRDEKRWQRYFPNGVCPGATSPIFGSSFPLQTTALQMGAVKYGTTELPINWWSTEPNMYMGHKANNWVMEWNNLPADGFFISFVNLVKL